MTHVDLLQDVKRHREFSGWEAYILCFSLLFSYLCDDKLAYIVPRSVASAGALTYRPKLKQNHGRITKSGPMCNSYIKYYLKTY